MEATFLVRKYIQDVCEGKEPVSANESSGDELPYEMTTTNSREYLQASGNFTSECFKLDPEFVESYREVPEPFGFNGLGHITYLRTYSRLMEDGTKERWFQTIERVVNGTYNMQKDWVEANQLEWKPKKAQNSAREMYRLIFEPKFSPPGRGLWAMGSPLTEKKKLYACLNNWYCSYTSFATL